MDCIVLLYKVPGVTSYDALRTSKRVLGKKCGHAGTLDKFAEGLLISFSGRFTRLNDLFMGLDKTYLAGISFGKETDTLDPEGETVAVCAEIPTLSQIKSALSHFSSSYLQAPPSYSAVHVNGKRAYELARGGNDVEMPKKKVSLFSYEILSYEDGILNIRLNVSKGFYVRSFARDLALFCGSRAFVSTLKREKIGGFDASSAVLCNDADAIRQRAEGFDAVEFLGSLSCVCVKEMSDEQLIKMKKSGEVPETGDREYTLFTCKGDFAAMVRSSDKKYLAQAVIGC